MKRDKPVRVLIVPTAAWLGQGMERGKALGFTHVLARGHEGSGLTDTLIPVGENSVASAQGDAMPLGGIAPSRADGGAVALAGAEAWREDIRVSAALRAYAASDPRYRRHEMTGLISPLYGVLPTPGTRFVPIAAGGVATASALPDAARREKIPTGAGTAPAAQTPAAMGMQTAAKAAATPGMQPCVHTPPAALYGVKPWPPLGTHPRHLPADAGWLRDATWRALSAYCAMTPGGYALEMRDIRGEGREAFVTELNALVDTACPYRGAARMWVHTSDMDNPVMIFMVRSGARVHMLAANFGTAFLAEYVIGIPRCDGMSLLLSTDRREFGGCGYDLSGVAPVSAPSHGFPMSVTLALPPLAALIYRLN